MSDFDPRDPTAITWALLYQTFTAIFKETERALSPAGISGPQAFALSCLRYGGSPMIPSRLANYLAQESQSLTSLIDRMEQHGWVRRVRDLPDRRSLRLEITPVGEEKLAEAQEEGFKSATAIFACLNQDELRTLANLLDRVRASSLNRLGLDPLVGTTLLDAAPLRHSSESVVATAS
ncbi:MAG: MarR family winged helix-turn-helix transcriptional regulator [Dehalococcoidia bacterium]